MGFALKQDPRYTVAQYLTWPEDGPRYELIDGVPEYLLIDPAYRFAELYGLDTDGRHPEPEVSLAEDALTPRVAPGFSLTFHDLFGWPLQIEARQDIPSYG